MNQTKLETCRAAAKRLGIPIKTLADTIRGQDDETALLSFSEIAVLSSYKFYCCPNMIRGIMPLFDYSNLIKSDIYEAWTTGQGYLGDSGHDERLITVFRLPSKLLMAFYPQTVYSGVGGIYVREADHCGKGYCCEPFKNWLISHVPRTESED